MGWSKEEVLQVIEHLRSHRGDNATVEVKKAAGGLPINLPETLCAFANMPEGGTIILGVDEKADFELVGVPNAAEIEAGIVSQARNLVHPAPWVDTETVTIDDKSIVVCSVANVSLMHKPALYKGKAYLRQADGDYVMNDSDLRMLEVAKLGANERTHYDEAPVPGTSVADLDEDLLREFIVNSRKSSRRLAWVHDDTELLRLTRIITSDGELTLAGLYALGNYPQGPEPGLHVTAAVRLPRDESQQRTRNLTHFDGPLPTLLQDAMDWVEQNLSTVRVYLDNGHMTDLAELPLSAIREIIANALVHRDLGPNTLGAGKSVQIRLLPDALIITSPGGLQGVSIRQLESADITPVAVNPRLYYIARQLRTPEGYPIIEGEGGGIREAIESMDDRNLGKPIFTDNGVHFSVRLLRHGNAVMGLVPARATEPQPVIDGNTETDAQLDKYGKNASVVYRVIDQRGSINLNDIVDATALSKGQVRYALKALLDNGLVTMVGTQGRRDTVYKVSR